MSEAIFQLLEKQKVRGEGNREIMLTHVNSPEASKTLDVRYQTKEAAFLLNKSASALKLAERNGKIPAPSRRGSHRWYSPQDLEAIRTELGNDQHRPGGATPAIIAMQNFKGGVGKTTASKHFADYLGAKGYRVLVIDTDPQASLTAFFDLWPADVEVETTIYGFLRAEERLASLKSIVRRTVWPTIDLIPATIDLHNLEFELVQQARRKNGFNETLGRLRRGVAEVAEDYDVVVIDPPPSMGMIGVSVMAAANGLVIPLPSRNLDYDSTLSFLAMYTEMCRALNEHGVGIELLIYKVLCSAHSPERESDKEMLDYMKVTFGNSLIETPILQSEEIKNASTQFRSLFELAGPIGHRETYKRCKENLYQVYGELESEIRDLWERQQLAQTELRTEAA